jgi:hypothetical protein
MEGDEPQSLWETACTKYIVSRVLGTFSKFSPGAKFDKAFCVESNR